MIQADYTVLIVVIFLFISYQFLLIPVIPLKVRFGAYSYGIINLFKLNRNDGGTYWETIEVISYEALLGFAESVENKAIFTEMRLEWVIDDD